MREPQFLAIFAEHGANLRSLDSRIADRDLAALQTMKIDKRFAVSPTAISRWRRAGSCSLSDPSRTAPVTRTGTYDRQGCHGT
jgi:hypothetical protein